MDLPASCDATDEASYQKVRDFVEQVRPLVPRAEVHSAVCRCCCSSASVRLRRPRARDQRYRRCGQASIALTPIGSGAASGGPYALAAAECLDHPLVTWRGDQEARVKVYFSRAAAASMRLRSLYFLTSMSLFMKPRSFISATFLCNASRSGFMPGA